MKNDTTDVKDQNITLKLSTADKERMERYLIKLNKITAIGMITTSEWIRYLIINELNQQKAKK